MQLTDLHARLESARRAVERSAQLLLNPSSETLDECLDALTAATTALVGCQTYLSAHAGDPALRAEADRLRQGVQLSGSLLKTAADYHMRWLRILSAAMGGYTADGEAASVSGPARVFVQG
jgi:hypothetical protein